MSQEVWPVLKSKNTSWNLSANTHRCREIHLNALTGWNCLDLNQQGPLGQRADREQTASSGTVMDRFLQHWGQHIIQHFSGGRGWGCQAAGFGSISVGFCVTGKQTYGQGWTGMMRERTQSALKYLFLGFSSYKKWVCLCYLWDQLLDV